MTIFHQYKDYLSNYNISIVAIQGMTQKYDRFAKLVDFFEMAQQQTTKLNLESFLIMPVQRIPRYLLLMRDMLKYTHKHHPDYPRLTKALSTLGLILQDHNKGIDEGASDHAHKLLAIGNSIANIEEIKRDVGGSGLITAGRKFIHEGEAILKEKIPQKQKFKTTHIPNSKLKQLDMRGSMKPYLFLFDDILIYCEQCISKKEQTVDRPFAYGKLLQLVRVTDIQTLEKEPKTVRINLVGQAAWSLKTKTVEECNNWIGVLRKVVVQLNGTG